MAGKRIVVRAVCLVALLATVVPLVITRQQAAHAAGRSVLEHFVTRTGDKLMDGPDEFRFVSTNMPDILQTITDKKFESDTQLRLPNEYELRDAVETVKQMHGQVLRTFVVTVADGTDPSTVPYSMVNAPAGSDEISFNENAMRVLDKLLQICNEEGIRLYIPLVNYKATLRGGTSTYGENFFTVGSRANLRFKDMVGQLLNRTNVYTGVPYKNDKAIMGWESGNEIVIDNLPERAAWLHDLAKFVKTSAPNQLFIDGRNKPDDVVKFVNGSITHDYDEYSDDPNIDVLSYHTYVGLTGPATDSRLPENIRTSATGDIGATPTVKIIRELTKGKTSLVVGEIAMYTSPSTLTSLLDEAIADGTGGANWWGTRFHSRDGGFYKHSDADSQYEDLNWPGFPGSASYLPEIQTEITLQQILVEKAWKITGHTGPPPLSIPAAPHLLPIADVGHISWQGSTGAQSYTVQRSESKSGPWTTAGVVYDNLPTYSSLFHDAGAKPGHSYYYRVIAQNSSGSSRPSNVSAKVVVNRQWIVDDLFDFSKTYDREPNAIISKSYGNSAQQEDLGVLKSRNGTSTSVQYAVGGTLTGAAVFAYNAPAEVSLYGSEDGKAYYELPTKRTTYVDGSRTKYSYAGPSKFRFFKIEASGSAVVSRLQVEYKPGGPAAPAPREVPPYREPNPTFEAELFTYDEANPARSDVVTNEPGVVKVNQTGGSSSSASNKRYSIVDFLKAGDYAVFYTTVEAGTYDLNLGYDARAARGRFQPSLLAPGEAADSPGTPLGGVIDAYDPGSGVIKTADAGAVTFPVTGRYGFKFTSAGTNPASSNPKIGLDVIKLISENVAPVASDATYPTNRFTPVKGTLPASDGNGDPLAVTVVSQPARGRLEVRPDRTFTYTPDKGSTGQFTVQWKVNDGWVNSRTAVLTFDVKR
ncbi:Ig-like domain-containing protein [Kribbella sp. NPDC048915]|uniref:Ig-like domain-containing protein n=1 Tax=Kribbella sp. NPDC048915 TaxID=3155148 RepID=UPI0033D17850